MLTLLKKQSPDAIDPSLKAWHPDFRNERRLPDTKVIRTSFVLNGAFVLLACILVGWAFYRTYQWRELTAQISAWQAQIDRNKAASDQAIALNKQFQVEAAKANEVATFVRSRPLVSELLLHLGEVLPDYVAIDRLELNAVFLNIRGSIRGAPDQASGRASSYLQLLKSDPFLIERFSEITLLNLNKNPKGGLSVEIAFKLKEGKKS